ncbi:MAG: hypothetical protein J2P19_00960 [Pseudonocardia sp.]|nr:hypothetical protein [Pseudonocardia sp.]
MSTFWMILAYGFLIFLAFQAGRSADAARERALRQQTADEVRRLTQEREWLAAERERYLAAVEAWRRETRQGVRTGGGDRPPSGTPPLAA